jgi:hypothetical protein
MVPLPDQTKVTLFIVVKLEAEAKAWELKLKAKKPLALAAGTCKLQTKDGMAVQVALDKVKGDRTNALKAAQLAFKLDKKVLVADPLAKNGKGDAALPAVKAAPPAKKAAEKTAPVPAKTAAASAPAAQAAKQAENVLANFGLPSSDIQEMAKKFGVSVKQVTEFLSQHAPELKAEAKKIQQEAQR